MVSLLYPASKFYEMQGQGKVASKVDANKKLKFGASGYYLNKSTPNGQMYKQKVKSNDLVYARSESVTMYNKNLDKSKRTQGMKEGVKVHKSKAHMGDRVAETGRKYNI